MSYRIFLDVRTMQSFVPLAKALGVLRDPDTRDFVDAYRLVGRHRFLDEDWKAKRSEAIEQALAAPPPSWWAGGLPSRAHLHLIMWAFTPTPGRLARFVAERRRLGIMRKRKQERSTSIEG